MSDLTPGDELTTLIRLVGPADGSRHGLVALSWAPGSGPGALTRQMGRRARAALAARVGGLRSGQQVHVVRPTRGSLRPGLRDRLRRRAGSGYVAYRTVAGHPLLLDHVLADVGAQLVSPLAVGADGAVRGSVSREGAIGLLRMGVTGSPADPTHALAGLRSLATLSCPVIPAVTADGRTGAITWVVEELRPGRRPVTLSPTLLDQVAGFVRALPDSDHPVDVTADVERVAGVAGRAAAGVRAAGRIIADSEPSRRPQLRHGDLWAGNLLADGDVLTGVVDWDAWMPAGVPAVDLLHLLATDARIRTRASLGEVWSRRPWDDAPFTELARSNWPEWGADAESRAAVGLAWWLGQLAADLRRNPVLGTDPTWVARNVTLVADRLT